MRSKKRVDRLCLWEDVFVTCSPAKFPKTLILRYINWNRHRLKRSRSVSVKSDPNMTVIEAARRRDFTINSMAGDPLTGELFDPFGGAKDLRNRVLRVTDEERFRDDPLRVMRALQF